MQSSIQACFETGSFLAGTFLRSPGEFWALQLASLGVVCSSLLLYCAFLARRRRGAAAAGGYQEVRMVEEQEGLLGRSGSSELTSMTTGGSEPSPAMGSKEVGV